MVKLILCARGACGKYGVIIECDVILAYTRTKNFCLPMLIDTNSSRDGEKSQGGTISVRPVSHIGHLAGVRELIRSGTVRSMLGNIIGIDAKSKAIQVLGYGHATANTPQNPSMYGEL